jgi:hypothetical protein
LKPRTSNSTVDNSNFAQYQTRVQAQLQYIVWSHNKSSSYPDCWSASQQSTQIRTKMFGQKPYTFAASKLEPTPEMSPKWEADPETVTSGKSGFKSTEKSLAPKTKG